MDMEKHGGMSYRSPTALGMSRRLTTQKSELTQSLSAAGEWKVAGKRQRTMTSASSRLLTSATSRSRLQLPDPSSASSPRLSDSSDLFPGWLTSRKDFMEVKSQYERLDCIDCFAVCAKTASHRNGFERQAVVKLMRACPFFCSMKDYQLLNISERMHSVAFKSGQKLIVKGEVADCLYLIVRGKVGIYIDSEKPVDEVIEKNVIGEAAIQSRSARTATVIAHGDILTLRLTYEDFDIVAFKIKLMDFNLVSTFLQSLAHFSAWSVAKLYRLASVMIVKQYVKGQTPYRISESAYDLFIVREGTVALKVEIQVEKRNRWPLRDSRWQEVCTTNRFEKTLRVCRTGDFFGEEEMLEGVARKSTAVCTSDSCLLFLVRDDYFREIFSERDKAALCPKQRLHPTAGQLRTSLTQEKAAVVSTTEAMLDGLETNCLPEGRDVFEGGVERRRMKWARLLVRRKKTALQKDLVKKEKKIREIALEGLQEEWE